MSERGYLVGRWLESNWIFILLAAGVGVLIWLFGGAWSPVPPVPRQLQPQASQAENHKPVESAYVQLQRRCTSEIDSMRLQAEGFMKKRNYQAAYDTLHECRMFTVDPKVLKVYEEATIAVTKETARANAQMEKAIKAARKKEGVRIGMSQQEVVDSSWGRPRTINRTTRASGTQEQWVYDGGYLYFEDGVLTTIQN